MHLWYRKPYRTLHIWKTALRCASPCEVSQTPCEEILCRRPRNCIACLLSCEPRNALSDSLEMWILFHSEYTNSFLEWLSRNEFSCVWTSTHSSWKIYHTFCTGMIELCDDERWRDLWVESLLGIRSRTRRICTVVLLCEFACGFSRETAWEKLCCISHNGTAWAPRVLFCGVCGDTDGLDKIFRKSYIWMVFHQCVFPCVHHTSPAREIPLCKSRKRRGNP